jgi:coenzyme F420-dependent glucose-6-phosphate dehydrogenase
VGERSPDTEILETFASAGGSGPRFGQVTVCWAPTREEAVRISLEQWSNAGLKGPLAQELPLPSHFEAAAEMVSEDDIAEMIACGPDPEVHAKMIRKFVDAGYDHIYIHQVGPDQEGFMRFYEKDVIPDLAPSLSVANA